MSGTLSQTPGLNIPTAPPLTVDPNGNPVGGGVTGAPLTGAVTTAPPGLLNAPISTTTPPTTTPSTTAPAPGAPPVATYDPTTATATKADATGYTAAPFTVAPNQTVSDQIQHIIASGSPLMQQAEANARNQMNQRGLINSTMGINADQTALYSAATPIATADANTFNQAATNTTTAQNKAAADLAAAQNTASLANSQTGTQNAQFNAGAANTAGQTTAAASNTLAQTLAQISGSKDVAEIQTTSSQAIARIQSDTTLTAQDKQDQTNQILANIQANTTLTNTDKANASAQTIAQIQSSTTLSATDKQNANAQIIAQLNANTNLTIQDKATQSAQIIAQLNAATNLSVQDKQDLTTQAVQASQVGLQTYLGDLSSNTQKTIQQKSAEASAALAAVNNISAQAIAGIQANGSLTVAQQQGETQKLIAAANNQNAVTVQNMQNAAALDNIKQNGQINTAITELTNANKSVLQTSQGAATLYNQALANIQAIMTSPNLNTQQQSDAMNNTIATLRDGLAAFSSIAGNASITSTLNFGGGGGGGTTTGGTGGAGGTGGQGTGPAPTIAANTDYTIGVDQLYQHYFGRDATQAEQDKYRAQYDAAQLEGGSNPFDAISTQIGALPGAGNWTGGGTTPAAPRDTAADTQTITQLYQQVLGRAPDAGGLKVYLSALQNGQTPDQLRQTLTSSPEAQQRTAQNTATITNAFQQNLGRAPNSADMQYYLGQIANGQSPTALANSIAQSPDAQTYKAANTNTITQAFQSSLGRAPTDADLQYYLGQIANGQSASAIANSIAQSPDAKAYAASKGGTGLLNQPVTTTPTTTGQPVDQATQSQIVQAYMQKFGAPPTQDQLQPFLAQIQGGVRLVDVIAGMGTGGTTTAPPATNTNVNPPLDQATQSQIYDALLQHVGSGVTYPQFQQYLNQYNNGMPLAAIIQAINAL